MTASPSLAASGDPARRSRPRWGKIVALGLLLATVALAWRFTPIAEIATAHNILAWARMARGHWWAPLVLVAAYIVGACVLFPRPLLTLAAVVTFGVRLGVACSVAGVLAAALVTYAAGRTLAPGAIRRIAGDRLAAAAQAVKQHGVIAVFAANMVPAPPFVVQNIVAGAIRVPAWQFLAGTALSLVPGVIAWSLFGRQVTSALEDISNVNYWIIGATALAFGLFLYFARRWARGKLG